MTLDINKIVSDGNDFLSKNNDFFVKKPDDLYGLFDLQKSVSAVNDVARGLSISLPTCKLTENFNFVLGQQQKIYETVLDINERFAPQISKVQNLLNDYVTPNSNLLASVGLAATNAVRLHESGFINNPLFEETKRLSGLVLNVVEEQQKIVGPFLRRVEDSGVLGLTLNSYQQAAQNMVSIGLETAVQALPTYPTQIVMPNLEFTRKSVEFSFEDISDSQKHLDKILEEIDPILVEYRRAAWQAFRNKKKDYVGQSSSSMRRLVDTLLRKIAPQEKVKATEYFKESTKSLNEEVKPTRKAKILYVANYDRVKAEHLKRLADGFEKVYGNLSAWDHAPLSGDKFVEGTFISIEGYLISLLSTKEQ